MSQQDIYEFLAKKRKWVTTSELREAMQISRGNISGACVKLQRQGQIDVKVAPGWHREYCYRIKMRVKKKSKVDKFCNRMEK